VRAAGRLEELAGDVGAVVLLGQVGFLTAGPILGRSGAINGVAEDGDEDHSDATAGNPQPVVLEPIAQAFQR
jgi:hypothetical protein